MSIWEERMGTVNGAGGFMDLSLMYCGWEHCLPGHRFGPNLRETCVLHVVLEGSGWLEMDQRRYTLSGGEAFYIPAGAEAWYQADAERPWTYLWFGFAGLKAESSAAACGFGRRTPVRRLCCMAELERLAEQVFQAGDGAAGELRRNALLMLAMAVLAEEYEKLPPELRPVPEHPAGSGQAYVRQAMEYMARNYNRQIRIGELAAMIGLNRSHLTELFRRSAGCSPQEFLMRLRMERAQMLLSQTDMDIRTLAGAVGYEDQLAFSKAFRRRYGLSPSAYRRQSASQAPMDAGRRVWKREGVSPDEAGEMQQPVVWHE